ncbi:MAG: ATP-dependent Clp protease adapter ClpS [Proteobacteria bacterium]|nr:ATP-dependent Clp protease adapter ClpS [Pseudomonadota bacterium]
MSAKTKTTSAPEGGLALQERPEVRQPRLYQVLLHNDDYTTMEFVVGLLIEHFHKTETEATQIMLSVHLKGVGVCGVYTFDLAETKAARATEAARREGHPLKCTVEPE